MLNNVIPAKANELLTQFCRPHSETMLIDYFTCWTNAFTNTPIIISIHPGWVEYSAAKN